MLYLLETEIFDDEFIHKIKEAEKKYFVSDRKTRNNKPSLCGRVLLGYILKNQFGIDSFSYRYGENGKPYLKGEELYFSISHSGECVICCVSDSEIGCDTEIIKAYNPRIGRRFFTVREAELLEKAENKDELFTKLWTLKESILKKEATGIVGGLDTYCFADFTQEECFSAYGNSFYTVRSGEYMISVCSDCAEIKTENVTKEKIADFIRSLG